MVYKGQQEMNWGFKRFRFVLKTEVALSNSHLVSGHFNFSHFDCGCAGRFVDKVGIQRAILLHKIVNSKEKLKSC